MAKKHTARKSTRSVAVRRRALRTEKDMRAAEYGASDLIEVAGLSQAQITTWLREGIIEPTRQTGGLRVFNLRELVLAAVAQSIASTGSKISLKRVMRQVRASWKSNRVTVAKLLTRETPVRLKIELAGEVGAGSNTVRNPNLKPAGGPEGAPVSLTLEVNLTEIAARIVALLINPNLAAGEDDGARAKSA